MKAEKSWGPIPLTSNEADSLVQRPVTAITNSSSPTSKLAGVLASFALLQSPASSLQSAACSLASALVARAIDIRIRSFPGEVCTQKR